MCVQTCLYVYVYIHLYIYIQIYMYIHTHTHLCSFTDTHTCTCLYGTAYCVHMLQEMQLTCTYSHHLPGLRDPAILARSVSQTQHARERHVRIEAQMHGVGAARHGFSCRRGLVSRLQRRCGRRTKESLLGMLLESRFSWPQLNRLRLAPSCDMRIGLPNQASYSALAIVESA